MSQPDSGPGLMNVFISYSRDDLEFSDQLEKMLQVTGFEVSLDRHGISGGEDWKQRLGSLILNADTVVFVLSPSSAASDVCKWEVGRAVQAGKRIIPILCRPLDGTTPPQQLADLNYIFFYPERSSPGSGFGSGLQKLVEALNTDLDWLREHTRLLERATEWEAGERAANRLLSGGDVAAAKAWAAARPKTAPAPLPLQMDFIRASEVEQNRRHNEEAQRLAQMAQAQAQREAALDEKEAAQAREAEARQREAAQARKVAQRTRLGAAVALCLAIAAGGTAIWANQNRLQAERDRAVAQAALQEQRRIIGDAFETGWTALGLERRPPSQACESMPGGVRVVFCSVEQVISLQTLANLSGLPVFVTGPHSTERRLADNAAIPASEAGGALPVVKTYGYNLRAHEIGHYNPEFLDWLIDYAVPATQDPGFLAMTRPLYDEHLHALLLTYEDAFALVNDPRVADMRADLLAEYRERLARYTEADELARWEANAWENGAWANSPHYWLMQEMIPMVSELTDLSPDYQGGESFELRVAMEFWFRRAVDGTDGQFHTLMRTVLETYGTD